LVTLALLNAVVCPDVGGSQESPPTPGEVARGTIFENRVEEHLLPVLAKAVAPALRETSL
jgi:hypothetical protein